MHTPGPWSIAEDGCDFYVEPAGDITVAVCSVLPIDSNGTLGDYARGPVTRANAALIATAPELLALVRQLASCEIPEAVDYAEEARRLVDKAEGGAA